MPPVILDKKTPEILAAEAALEEATERVREAQMVQSNARGALREAIEKAHGLVRKVSILRSLSSRGVGNRGNVRGVYVHLHGMIGVGEGIQPSVAVQLLKRDGTLGNRTAVFYDWEGGNHGPG
ncbi:MAG: hypothetical protein HC889_16100 [Synechococcaceae cyanobacterium SM1_2_3]|nr:hypothetical protein [Synechococcaceae cyanobacterium SM1_2_3]